MIAFLSLYCLYNVSKCKCFIECFYTFLVTRIDCNLNILNTTCMNILKDVSYFLSLVLIGNVSVGDAISKSISILMIEYVHEHFSRF